MHRCQGKEERYTGGRAAGHTGWDTLPASPAEQGGRESTAHKVEATSKGDSARGVAGVPRALGARFLGHVFVWPRGYSWGRQCGDKDKCGDKTRSLARSPALGCHLR